MELTFNNKTLADILKAHPEYKRILLKFYHGLGDAIAFHANCLPALRRAFPGREFSVDTTARPPSPWRAKTPMI